MKRLHTWALAAAVLTCAVAGCGRAVQRTERGNGIRVLADEVPLRVRNNNRAEMKVFVLVGGTWRQIGAVPAGSNATFELAVEEWNGAALRILAVPVGGHGAARTDPLTVFPGQTVTFTIEPDLALSSAAVR